MERNKDIPMLTIFDRTDIKIKCPFLYIPPTLEKKIALIQKFGTHKQAACTWLSLFDHAKVALCMMKGPPLTDCESETIL